VRNTLRFLLSNLNDFSPAGAALDFSAVAPTSLDAWVLAKYETLAATVIKAYEDFDFKTVNKSIFDFCNETLSAEYLAAVKDRLYCDAPASPRRRLTQAVLWGITDGLCRLLAPIMPHTADEAYRALWKATDDSRCVHFEEFIRSFGVKSSPNWPKALAARDAAKGAMERAKSQMGVENPLDAGVVLPDPDGTLASFDLVDLADLLGVSEVELDRSATEPRVVDLRSRPRCERSWRRDKTVRQRSDGGVLSDRDALAVGVV
jgi:isoleucyl-tRNA synthetase